MGEDSFGPDSKRFLEGHTTYADILKRERLPLRASSASGI